MGGVGTPLIPFWSFTTDFFRVMYAAYGVNCREKFRFDNCIWLSIDENVESTAIFNSVI